ncbi:class I SAM-dependent methyltransferase [Bradyrhizobium jicamae]|uniref:class I SAM-dependent methyltransferase n=1 Tax=Bradyrhizobium jicamae TaxID=280332 RepID=UPI001BA4E0B8|nr:class I SAM-dependent methyltransferase [Bradyrhizobium jicamae]MBR0750745.1 class I SAM-dependent methyltransferase [Bradyrhizobium jicamae]
MTIEKSVKHVASAWKESPYYADAERWTHLFWGNGTIFLRLFKELPLDNVIELAAGHGRHSEQIANQCGTLTLMDIHQENIDACRNRLGHFPELHFILNNGYNFEPIAAVSISAIFCYDAMVHFAPDVVQSYIKDTHRILRSGGMALYHHSNLSAPGTNYAKNTHARNHMTEELFKSFCDEAGMEIVESIPISWGNVENLDRISLIQRP